MPAVPGASRPVDRVRIFEVQALTVGRLSFSIADTRRRSGERPV